MDLIVILLVIAVLGTGIVAGVFFAFSGFVVAGLDLDRADVAARAMRGINVTALRAPLMIALFGTALVAIALAVVAFTGGVGGGFWWVFGATVLYIAGVVGVTAAANVPRNAALAAATETDAALGDAWAAFRPGWLAWNHVRWVTSALACLGYLIALLVR